MTHLRELWNIENSPGNFPLPDRNEKALGNKCSHAKDASIKASKGAIPECLQPGKQLAVMMRTPMATAGGVKSVDVLSVSGVALDSKLQPEFSIYVSTTKTLFGKEKQKLDLAAFEKSYRCIAQHILDAANEPGSGNPFVLPAIGLNNFIGALPKTAQKQAKDIGTKVLAELVRDLRAANKEVLYMDKESDGPIWMQVNIKLASLEQKPLSYAGAVPGPWIKDGMVLVNAWDPHSLVGNKLAKDNSIDGFIGRNSLVHFMHALHCMAHAEGVKFDFGQASN